MDAVVSRLHGYLSEYGRRYPTAWKELDMFRGLRGRKGFDHWPDWCWVPLSGSYAVISRGGAMPDAGVIDVGVLGALAAWRRTQGIYRFDRDLQAALLTTPAAGHLPVEILYRLPEWCVYLDMGDHVCELGHVAGVFAHLESDANDGRSELRFVVDRPGTAIPLMPVILHLTGYTVEECIEAALAEAEKYSNAELTSAMASKQARSNLLSAVSPIVGLLLYLCSEAAEMRDAAGRRGRPGNPVPRRVKGGLREFAAQSPTTWDVGWRIGAALRAGQAAQDSRTAGNGTHARPRPHIRRAHWHHHWRGPRREGRPGTDLVVRWQHPLLVAAGYGETDGLVPTVHQVE